LEGKYPAVSGCPEGTVFDDKSLNCNDPLNVPECEGYYETNANGVNIGESLPTRVV